LNSAARCDFIASRRRGRPQRSAAAMTSKLLRHALAPLYLLALAVAALWTALFAALLLPLRALFAALEARDARRGAPPLPFPPEAGRSRAKPGT
jgi:hypothetical protein